MMCLFPIFCDLVRLPFGDFLFWGYRNLLNPIMAVNAACISFVEIEATCRMVWDDWFKLRVYENVAMCESYTSRSITSGANLRG